jgi:adenylate cyclase
MTHSASAEIERKFLVRDVPDDLEQHPHEKIRQGYVSVSADGTEARVRDQGGSYFLTVKSGHGEARTEVELPIPEKTFDSLWPLTRGQRVRKVRYHVPIEGRMVEIDRYRRKLKGLVVAEVEFPDEDAARAFQPPEWLGEEVTGNDRFSNRALACHGLPEEVACGASC